MNIEKMKQNVAKAALEYIQSNTIIGIGTGSTVNYFISQLSSIKHKIDAAVSTSKETSRRLKRIGIEVIDLNILDEVCLYIDGTDAYNSNKQLTKGGGGALTQEKIVSYMSKTFICIVDKTKNPSILGTTFPIPIEVIPSARNLVYREIIKLNGKPKHRINFFTDNGNIIIDVYNWEITDPLKLEFEINKIPGVVCNGIFAARNADKILIGDESTVKIY